MRGGFSDKLKQRLLRPDRSAAIMAEIVARVQEKLIQTKSQWQLGTQSPAGVFEFFDDGTVGLAREAVLAASHGVDNDVLGDLDDILPMTLLRWRLDAILRLRAFGALLTRRRNAALPAFNGQWALQLYATHDVEAVRTSGGTFSHYRWRLVPLLDPAVLVDAQTMGSDLAFVTFDLQPYGLRTDIAVPEGPDARDYTSGVNMTGGPFQRELWFSIRAIPVRADGTKAVGTNNVGWRRDFNTQTELFRVATVALQRADKPGTVKEIGLSAMLRYAIWMERYPDPALGDATLTVDVSLPAPPGADDLEFQVLQEAPAGTTAQAYVSADGGTTFLPFKDGDRAGHELAIPKQQTYKLRWAARSDTGRTSTPVLHMLGVRERRTYDVSELVSVRELSGWAVDPVTLEASVGEVEVEVARDGVADFADLATRIVTQEEFADLELRLYIGARSLPRSDWALVEVLRIDDREPLAYAERFTAVSVLERLVGIKLPPIDPVANARLPLVYSNQTLKAAIEDIVDVRAALPARYRGQLIENTTDLVTKTITDSDALTEAAALAYIDGKALIASQGRIKAVNVHGPAAVVESFAREETEVLRFDPGFRRRQPEFFVRYGFQAANPEGFVGEVRSFNEDALLKLGVARIDAEPARPPEAVERWLPVDIAGPPPRSTLAEKIASRIPRFLGTGLILGQIRTSYPRPWLEVGDLVSFATDAFTGRDPITGREIKGRVSVTGVLVRQHDIWGTTWDVWVRGYADIVPAKETASRRLLREARVLSITLAVDASGNVTATIQADADTGSVRAAGSTTGFPDAATVRAQPPLNGRNVTTGTLVTVQHGQTAYVSVLPYTGPDATGIEGPLAQARITTDMLGVTAIATVAIAAGDVVRLFGDGTFTTLRANLADADTLAADAIVGVALEAASALAPVRVAIGKAARVNRGAETWGAADVAQPVYVSTTAGQATRTKPTAPGSRVMRLGIVTGAANGVVLVDPRTEGKNLQTFHRPNRDIETTDWTSTPLWDKIDEPLPHDGDTTRIASVVLPVDGQAADCEVGLSGGPTAPVGLRPSGTLRVTWRRGNGSDGLEPAGQIGATALLREGTRTIATLHRTPGTIGQTYQTHTLTLTQAELNAIGNANNLSLLIRVERVDATTNARGFVTHAELELIQLDPNS